MNDFTYAERIAKVLLEYNPNLPQHNSKKLLMILEVLKQTILVLVGQMLQDPLLC